MKDYGKQCKVRSAKKDGLQKHPQNNLSEMRKVRQSIEAFVHCFNIGREAIQGG